MKKDILEELFSSMPDQDLSANFTKNLMQEIQKQDAKIEKRESVWSVIVLVCTTMGMLGIGIYYIATSMTQPIQLPSFQMDWQTDLTGYQLPIMVGAMILLLLIGDHLLRRRYSRKI